MGESDVNKRLKQLKLAFKWDRADTARNIMKDMTDLEVRL